MSRRDLYRERQQEFLEYLSSHECPDTDKDKKIDIYNNDFSTELLCDLTDAICEIAKSLEGIKSDINQIRRHMPK